MANRWGNSENSGWLYFFGLQNHYRWWLQPPWKESYDQPAAAAVKSLQSCPTLCDSIDGSPQALLSLGFSRQEHWSGLPFSSLMHESEKWKWSRSVVSDSWRPHGLQPTRLLCPWDFPGKNTGVGCHCLLQVVFPTFFNLSLNFAIGAHDLSHSHLQVLFLLTV